jgi:hypothetical protein
MSAGETSLCGKGESTTIFFNYVDCVDCIKIMALRSGQMLGPFRSEFSTNENEYGERHLNLHRCKEIGLPVTFEGIEECVGDFNHKSLIE